MPFVVFRRSRCYALRQACKILRLVRFRSFARADKVLAWFMEVVRFPEVYMLRKVFKMSSCLLRRLIAVFVIAGMMSFSRLI